MAMKLQRTLLLAAIVVLQGCAFTKATLDVHASPDLRVAGPLSDIEPLRFDAPQLDDARLDKARIGWKKNGFGQNTADITTAQPVDELVESAVSKALTDTRHAVGGDGRIQLVGAVERFWFDTDTNFWTVKFMGDVQCSLDFIDAQTKQSIYKKKYAGSYAEDKAGGLNKTWAMIMGKALDKLIEDIVLDEDLATALKAWREKSTAAGGG
jgi:uncharacterized lipoprotein YajG